MPNANKLPTLLVCLMVLSSALAWSASSAAAESDTALAEALFRDGRELMDAEKYAEACPKFEESYRLVRKLGTLLNLATCHDKWGKTGSAWGEYSKAVTQAKKEGEPKRVEYARAQLEALEGRLSNVVIEVPEPVPGTEVLIDGKAIGKAVWRTPIPLDPGTHELVARAPGHKTWSGSIEVPAGPSSTTKSLPALVPLPEGQDDTESTPDAAADEGSNTQWIIGWVVTGVGVVGVGVGSYFGIDTFIKQGDSEDHCQDTLCDQDGVDLRADASTSATISTIAVGAGLATTAVGVVLLLTAGGDEGDEGPAQEAFVVPLLGDGLYGLQWGASW